MIDLTRLSELAAQGPVVRVVVAEVKGSAPREAGAEIFVTPSGTHGTIGGGTLEHQAIAGARAMLALGTAAPRTDRIPLGPALGQCCGGAVALVSQVFTRQTLPDLPQGVLAQPLDGSPMPLSVKRLLARARAEGIVPPTQILQGWLIDPVAHPSRDLWIWGAGHVGRALIATLAPLPHLSLTWIDVSPDRFPADIPRTVRALPVTDPVQAVALAPAAAEHLILTFSHTLDLALCHALLTHGFSACGLIGSATKRARFTRRLASLGHARADIARIACPIGAPTLGKHPQAIAIGVAAEILSRNAPAQAAARKIRA